MVLTSPLRDVPSQAVPRDTHTPFFSPSLPFCQSVKLPSNHLTHSLHASKSRAIKQRLWLQYVIYQGFSSLFIFSCGNNKCRRYSQRCHSTNSGRQCLLMNSYLKIMTRKKHTRMNFLVPVSFSSTLGPVRVWLHCLIHCILRVVAAELSSLGRGGGTEEGEKTEPREEGREGILHAAQAYQSPNQCVSSPSWNPAPDVHKYNGAGREGPFDTQNGSFSFTVAQNDGFMSFCGLVETQKRNP